MSQITGRIDIIIGCMFSGKSTEMIRLVKKYKVINKNIIVINHNIDNRYGTSVISTHNLDKINCVSLSQIVDIKNHKDFDTSDVIFIEEAQFFNDLYDFCIEERGV